MLLIFCSVFTLYNWLITFSGFLFVFCSSTSAVFTAVLIMSSMIPLTIRSLDIHETVGNLSIELFGALLCLFMFLLIFNEQRVLKFTFVLVLTYYVNHSLEGAPHLFVILTAIGWFIVNIQSDLFWYRCLERQTFGTPRMYTLSPSKSIKRSNNGEFLKDNNVLLMYTTVLSAYKYAPNLESLLTQQYVCIMCTLWSDNTCVFTRFYSVKNANTQLIWSSGNSRRKPLTCRKSLTKLYHIMLYRTIQLLARNKEAIALKDLIVD
jgi:hypothetical protein